MSAGNEENLVVLIDLQRLYHDPNAVAVQTVVFSVRTGFLFALALQQFGSYVVVVILDHDPGDGVAVVAFLNRKTSQKPAGRKYFTNSSRLWILTTLTSFLSRNMKALLIEGWK